MPAWECERYRVAAKNHRVAAEKHRLFAQDMQGKTRDETLRIAGQYDDMAERADEMVVRLKLSKQIKKQ